MGECYACIMLFLQIESIKFIYNHPSNIIPLLGLQTKPFPFSFSMHIITGSERPSKWWCMLLINLKCGTEAKHSCGVMLVAYMFHLFELNAALGAVHTGHDVERRKMKQCRNLETCFSKMNSFSTLQHLTMQVHCVKHWNIVQCDAWVQRPTIENSADRI